MIGNRDAWMDLLFSDEVEGGWSDRPKHADPGGKTMRGISIGCYSDFLGREATPEELKQITADKAREIALTMFWNPSSCDFLPGGLDILVADTAFHSGWPRAAKILQKLVGVDADGFIGPDTTAAARKQKPRDLVMNYADARMDFLEDLPNWEPNARGWRKRVKLMRDLALTKVQKNPTLTEAIKNPTVVTTATSTVAGGAGVWYYFDQLSPLWDAVKHVLDPQSIEKLKSVDDMVVSAGSGDPLQALLTLAYMTITGGVAIYFQIRQFRKGRTVA